ncbi:MAG: DUF4395 domain-containing protein [Spirochaetia bacterium]|jgi:hypothetical protein
MGKMVRIGEDVEGYAVPVLNEREIRASAGMLFLAMLLSYLLIIFKGNFLLIKYVITIFLADMTIRVCVNPGFSPSLIIGRLIVRNQTPEYVGARQKRFAWTICMALSATMFALMVVANTYSPITGITCLICLTFLFFESAFGICLGCKFYPLFFKNKAHYCPGEACEAKSRKGIQKTSKAQMLVVLGSIAFIFLAVFLFNGSFSKKPHALFGMGSSIGSDLPPYGQPALRLPPGAALPGPHNESTRRGEAL